MRLMSEAMPLRTIQQTARGSETYLMLTSRTYNSMDAQEFFVNPSFAVINEGFGSNTKMLGGYFCPLESQMKHLAEGIALRLQGKMPAQQITPLPKEYVLNWHASYRIYDNLVITCSSRMSLLNNVCDVDNVLCLNFSIMLQVCELGSDDLNLRIGRIRILFLPAS